MNFLCFIYVVECENIVDASPPPSVSDGIFPVPSDRDADPMDSRQHDTSTVAAAIDAVPGSASEGLEAVGEKTEIPDIDTANLMDARAVAEAGITDKKKSSCEATRTHIQSSAGSASALGDTTPSIYHVKWIKFHGTSTPIVLQNQNGPCPLLAIVNILLLQGKIKLTAGTELVAADQLIAYIADYIFENVPKVSQVLCCII